jgi:hypothetical protein
LETRVVFARSNKVFGLFWCVDWCLCLTDLNESRKQEPFISSRIDNVSPSVQAGLKSTGDVREHNLDAASGDESLG